MKPFNQQSCPGLARAWNWLNTRHKLFPTLSSFLYVLYSSYCVCITLYPARRHFIAKPAHQGAVSKVQVSSPFSVSKLGSAIKEAIPSLVISLLSVFTRQSVEVYRLTTRRRWGLVAIWSCTKAIAVVLCIYVPTALIIPLLLLTINIAVNFESYLLIRLKAIACYDAVHSMTFIKTWLHKNLRKGPKRSLFWTTTNWISHTIDICLCDHKLLLTRTTAPFVYRAFKVLWLFHLPQYIFVYNEWPKNI